MMGLANGGAPHFEARILLMTRKGSGDCPHRVAWKGRWVCLRALRSDDAPRYADFHAWLDPRRMDGTFALLPVPEDMRAAACRDGSVTVVAVLDDGAGALVGIARAKRCPNRKLANVAVALRPDVEGQGLGRLLLGRLVTDCRAAGLLELAGETRVDNRKMIELAHAFRFVDIPSSVPGLVSFRLNLRQPLRD